MRIVILGADENDVEAALRGTYCGGGEKQRALIAKGLAERGHMVTVLEPTPGVRHKIEINHVNIDQSWQSEKGFPIIRAFNYRIPSLLHKIEEIGPDIVYCRAVSFYSALLARRSKNNKDFRLVFGLCADYELNPLKSYFTRIFKIGFYGLLQQTFVFPWAAKTLMKHSDLIVVQTTEQYECVARQGHRTRIISNIHEPYTPIAFSRPKLTTNPCLYVGRFSGAKGERNLLALARLLPECNFRVAGHTSDNFANSELMQDIKRQNNITLLGRLSYDELQIEYARSALLIHTGPAEGFSNAFLEAWAANVPVVSLHVNPNRLLTEGGLGFCAEGNMQAMALKVRHLLQSPEERMNMGEISSKYVATHHNSDTIISQYESVFHELASVKRDIMTSGKRK